jgi:hypothetical protein
VLTIAQRFNRRLYNVIRGWKIGLTDPEVDNAFTTFGKLIGPSQHCKRIFLTDTTETVYDLHGSLCCSLLLRRLYKERLPDHRPCGRVIGYHRVAVTV